MQVFGSLEGHLPKEFRSAVVKDLNKSLYFIFTTKQARLLDGCAQCFCEIGLCGQCGLVWPFWFCLVLSCLVLSCLV